MRPDGFIATWDRTGIVDGDDWQLVPSSVFAQSGTYHVVVERSGPGVVTAEFSVDHVVP